MKVPCIVCYKYKSERCFRNTGIKESGSTCNTCAKRLRLNTVDVVVPRFTAHKIRVCLRCDKKFRSYKERRICHPCKKVNLLHGEADVFNVLT